jgi:hypothetical protein
MELQTSNEDGDRAFTKVAQARDRWMHCGKNNSVIASFISKGCIDLSSVNSLASPKSISAERSAEHRLGLI